MHMITFTFILIMFILCERSYLYSTDQSDPRSVANQSQKRVSAQVIHVIVFFFFNLRED